MSKYFYIIYVAKIKLHPIESMNLGRMPIINKTRKEVYIYGIK